MKTYNDELKFKGNLYPLPKSKSRCESCSVVKSAEGESNWTFRFSDGIFVACCVGCGVQKSIFCKFCNNPTFLEEPPNSANQVHAKCSECEKRFGPITQPKHHKRSTNRRKLIQQHHQRADSTILGAAAPYLTCEHCKEIYTSDKIEMVHITPLAKGGSNSVANTIPLCTACRISKRKADF